MSVGEVRFLRAPCQLRRVVRIDTSRQTGDAGGAQVFRAVMPGSGSNDWILRKDGDKEFYVLNGEHVQRSRLRLDTRKWLLSKALPKVYGDKLAIASNAERTVVLRVLNIPTDDVEELKRLEEEENQ